MKNKNLIGIFDSGIGGFSVLKEIRNSNDTDILYFGDCARAPYGNRDKEEIALFIKEIILNLKDKGVTHFVSACNSMSVLTTGQLLKECDIEEFLYMDMIKAFKKHNDLPERAKVLLIGTQATISSNEYQNFLKDKVEKVFEYVPRTLAGSIELNVEEKELVDIVNKIIIMAKEIEATYIVYGCTHYPLVHDVFQKCANDMNWCGKFVDPAKYVAEAIREWNVSGTKVIKFETSKETEAFKRECDRL
jgi:glutamate racemase